MIQDLIIMIKQIFVTLLVLLLTSCVNLDMGYIEIFKEAIKKDPILLPKTNSLEYSFIKISYRDREAIFILSKLDSGYERWVGSNGEVIITKDGFITRTHGFSNDISMDLTLITPLNAGKFIGNISFTNPLMVHSALRMQVSNSSNISCNNQLDITKEIIQLGIKLKDQICYAKNGYPRRSIQYLFPNDSPFKIEYHYKFN